MMTKKTAVELLKAAENLDITVWIGGGFGVDALIGEETRPHNDIDVYIDIKNADSFINMLKSKGYSEVEMEYTTPSHTVWENPVNHIVDLHLIGFKEEDPDSLYFQEWTFPISLLDGNGTIGGHPVNCFTAEAQLLFHQGYKPLEKDIHNVKVLCKTFGLEVPEDYKGLISE